VARHFPRSIRPLPESGDRALLDLRAEIALRLSARIGAENVAIDGSCTAESPDRFFSHRRDGFPAGRMAAFVSLTGAASASS
jgi:copper oxidase (laccase) domain-containing protein